MRKLILAAAAAVAFAASPAFADGTAEDICYGLLTFLRWNIIRRYEDKWVNKTFQALVVFLKTERSLGKL